MPIRGTNSRSRNSKGAAQEGQGAQARILKAARKVFSEHSFKAATTRMIASEARVDHPLIHYYFGSKEKLFEAVTAEIYEEFQKANLGWLEGLETMKPRDGLSLYLDRMLEYNFENPEALQLILVNMVQAGNSEVAPGYQYLIMHMDRSRRTLKEKFPLKGSPAEVEMFIHSFNNLVISYIGARAGQAKVLKTDPENPEYRKRVKDALLALFLPWLENMIYRDGKS